MANLLNLKEHLKYCAHCSNLATHRSNMIARGTSGSIKVSVQFKCEEHKLKGSCSKKVLDATPFDQREKLAIVNSYLNTLVGKNIVSKFHTARQLRVKYLKENGGVMCFQEHSNKWKFVYYEQISEVLC